MNTSYKLDCRPSPCNESTNQTADYISLLERNPALAIPYVTIMTVLTVSGTFGNILVIVAIIKTKKLRTIGNAFVISMAVSDLGVTTFVDVSAITGVVHGRDVFVKHPILCHLIVSVGIICCLSSVGSILLVSLHRVFVIWFFIQKDKIFTKLSSGVMIAGMWLIGFASNFRYVMKWGTDGHDFDPKLEQCFYDRRTSSWFYRILSLLTLVVVTVSYAGIFYFVRRHRQQMHSKSLDKERENSIRLAYTLLFIVVMFYICTMPYAIVTIMDKDNVLSQEAYMLTILLLYSNSAINWIIYGLTNQQFREAFKQTLCPQKG